MKGFRGFLVLLIAAVLAGCGGGGIDENKPIEQVAAEAAKMGQEKLQSTVAEYESLIAEKAVEMTGLTAQLKELSIGELTGEKAKTLKTDMESLKTSLDKLKEQMAVYAKALSSVTE